MKLRLSSLKKGQELWAVVEENIAQGEAIINFSGELVRVANETHITLRPGQRVLLEVDSIAPLKLRLKSKKHPPSSYIKYLDITI